MKSLRLVIISLGSALSSLANAQDIKPFKEPFYMMTTECQTVAANMQSGELVKMQGGSYQITCRPTAELALTCDFLFDDKGKISKTRKVFNGGMKGLEAILQDNDKDELFVINLTSGSYYSESNAVASEGLLRGRKICAGGYISDTEFQRSIKPKE